MSRSLPTPYQMGHLAIHVFTALLTLTACGPPDDGPPGPSGHTVRDSAGITIVENSEPVWKEGEGWRFSPEPLLAIGVTDGPEEYILFRVVSARRLDGGRIVIGNSGTHELRFYDAQGTFLNATGTEGEGPGEFGGMGFIWRTDADSLVILDFGLRRFSVFDQGGGFARNFRLGEGSGDLAFPYGVFGDGSVLASVDEQDQGEYSDLGVVRGRSRFGRYDGEGLPMASLGSLPGTEFYKGTHRDGSGFTTTPPHGVRAYAVAGGSTWFYSSGDAPEFQERGLAGELLKIIRLDRDRRAMPAEIRADREERIRTMNPQSAALWSRVPLPDLLPAHGLLVLDRGGNLWVQGYVVLEEEEYWSVFDPDGRWLGDLTPPVGIRITEIGEDYLMGIRADTLGVEQVQIYGLEKGEGEGGSPM